MLEPVLAYALRNPLTTGLAAAVLALLLFAGVQTVRLTLAQADSAQHLAQLEACQTLNQSLKQSVETQNKAVTELAAQSLEMQRRLDRAVGAVNSMAVAHRKAVAKLKAVHVPADCSGAVRWAAKEGPALGEGWGAP